MVLDFDCSGGGPLVHGQPKVEEEIRQLIWRMRAENLMWGAPRIPGELLQFGFEYPRSPFRAIFLKRLPHSGKAKRWLAFLNNHREVVAAFYFFTVPTLSFCTLDRFFAIEHSRRILRSLVANALHSAAWSWKVNRRQSHFK
jgi:hypothetical protein